MNADEHKAMRLYNRIASSYHSSRIHNEMFYNEYLEMPATLSLLKGIRSKSVLDLGCGTGIYSRILKRRGARVHGVDISDNMVAIARKESKGIDFQVGSAYKLPYKSGSFDVVLSALVLEYVKDLNRAFREINRVLKKGGTFVFSMHNPVFFATRPKYKNRRLELHRIFLDYFKEGERKHHWSMSDGSKKARLVVTAFHPTYETILKAILRNGFVVADYIDAKPIKLGKTVDPKSYYLTSRIPYFCVFKVRKSG